MAVLRNGMQKKPGWKSFHFSGGDDLIFKIRTL